MFVADHFEGIVIFEKKKKQQQKKQMNKRSLYTHILLLLQDVSFNTNQ